MSMIWRDDPLLDRFSALDNRLASKVLYTYYNLAHEFRDGAPVKNKMFQ